MRRVSLIADHWSVTHSLVVAIQPPRSLIIPASACHPAVELPQRILHPSNTRPLKSQHKERRKNHRLNKEILGLHCDIDVSGEVPLVAGGLRSHRSFDAWFQGGVVEYPSRGIAARLCGCMHTSTDVYTHVWPFWVDRSDETAARWTVSGQEGCTDSPTASLFVPNCAPVVP